MQRESLTKEGEEPRAQGHSCLHDEFEANYSYTRHCLKYIYIYIFANVHFVMYNMYYLIKIRL